MVGVLLIVLLAPTFRDCYASKSFVVYDATLFTDKPDLSSLGVLPIHVAYEPHLFDQPVRAKRSIDVMPTDSRLRAQADKSREVGSNYTVIDIEAWSVNNSRRYELEVAKNIKKFEHVLTRYRQIAPDQKVGLFGPLPVMSGYERIDAKTQVEKYADMQRDNTNMTSLFHLVDALFPIGYTFTDRPEEWRASIEVYVSEIRRIRPDVPIFLFLWPRYADYGPVEKSLRSRPLDRTYWRYQLETAYNLVDGVVVWGGWGVDNKREQWDPEALWWKELREFLLVKRHSIRPAPPGDLTIR